MNFKSAGHQRWRVTKIISKILAVISKIPPFLVEIGDDPVRRDPKDEKSLHGNQVLKRNLGLRCAPEMSSKKLSILVRPRSNEESEKSKEYSFNEEDTVE